MPNVKRSDKLASLPLVRFYQSAKVDGSQLTISFTNVGGGLTTNNGKEPGDFTIAGSDKKFA